MTDGASRNWASRGFAGRDFAGRDLASRDFTSRDFTSRSFASRGVAGEDVAEDVASVGDASTAAGGHAPTADTRDATGTDPAGGGECASRAQHFHDLALEFLVMMRFTAATQVRERYRMMGQHYLARAGAELARAREDQPAGRRSRKRRRTRKAVSGWTQAAEAFQLDRVATSAP